jgi:ketosteroid isomerase-like protein
VTTDSHKAAAQDFFQKCFRGDLSSASEHLDPRVIYRVPGSHRLAGVFEGPEAVTRHVEELLRETHHTVDVLQWEDWMVGVNHLAALITLSARRQRVIGTFRAVFLVAVSDHDTIERIDVFFADQQEVERFFL